jgi:glutathione S-transferase
MKMKLYLSLTSPYARKVRMVAQELGLADLIQEVSTDPWNAQADFLDVNPLSKVPTLVTEKGETLPDSKLIVEYLLSRGRGLAALPRGAQRWALLRRQQLAEGILDAAVAMRLEQLRPPALFHQGWVERQAAAIGRALDALEPEAGELLLEGPVRTVEIAVGAALGYLDFRHGHLEWRKGRERLASWYFSFAQRPCMRSTEPPAA